MAEFSVDSADDLSASCLAGAKGVGDALEAALGTACTVVPDSVAEFPTPSPPEELDGPGLLILTITEGGSGAAVTLASASGLIPDWCRRPDTDQQSALRSLAESLARHALPHDVVVSQTAAVYVPDLSDALRRASVAAQARQIPMTIDAGDASAILRLVWPLENAASLLSSAEDDGSSAAATENPNNAAAPQRQPSAAANPPTLERLPAYGRSLLQISVPVVVELASKKQTVGEVLQLCPGSIIAFEKPCDEMLELHVGGCPVAQGEAVKVGDKFGLRINCMQLPKERFRSVASPK